MPIPSFVLRPVLFLHMHLFFDNSPSETIEQKFLLALVLLFNVLLDLIIEWRISLANNELVQLIVDLILHGIKFILEVLLLLSEELELPLPVGPAEFLGGQVVLLLLVDLQLVAHNLDHGHPCSISVVPSSHVNHFRESSLDIEVIHSWRNLFVELLHWRVCEQNRFWVSGSLHLVLLSGFVDQLFDPRSQRQSFVQSCYYPLMSDQTRG